MIYFIGDVGRDLYQVKEDSDETLHFWGGCALNAWHGAYSFDQKHRLLSIKGIDGDAMPALVRDEAKSWPSSFELQPIQEILLDPSGERHFGGYHAGALLDFTLGAKEVALLEKAQVIALPLFAQTKELCFEILTKVSAPVKIALDLGTGVDFDFDLSFLRPYQERLFWVQSSSLVLDFLGADTHQVITNGSKELIYLFEGTEERLAPGPIEVVDSTGAGDFVFGRSLALFESGLGAKEALMRAQREVKMLLVKCAPNLLEQ